MSAIVEGLRVWLRRPAGLAVVAVLLFGAGLRAHDFDRGFEYDEIYTLSEYAARLPASEILFGVGPQNLPNNHRLSTLLLSWVAADGVETHARLPSLLAGLLCLGLLIAFGRALGDVRVGLVAAALMATSAWSVYYAQAARGYALETALMLGHLLLWWRWREALTPRRAAALAALALAALVNLPLAALWLVPLGVFELWRCGAAWRAGRPWRGGLAATLAWALPSAAWLAYCRENLQMGAVRGGVVTGDAGTWAAHVGAVLTDVWALGLPWVCWLLVLAGLVVAARWRRPAGALLLLLAAPLALGLTGRMGPVRVHSVFVPWACLLAGMGWVGLIDRLAPADARPWLAEGLLCLAIVAGVVGAPGRVQRVLPPDLRAAVAHLAATARPGEAVWAGAHEGFGTSFYLRVRPDHEALRRSWFGNARPGRVHVLVGADGAVRVWSAEADTRPFALPATRRVTVGRQVIASYALRPLRRDEARKGEVLLAVQVYGEGEAAIQSADGLEWLGRAGAPFLGSSRRAVVRARDGGSLRAPRGWLLLRLVGE